MLIELNANVVVGFLVLVATCVYFLIRYTVLTKYSKLQNIQITKKDIEIPLVQEPNDFFLDSIQLFGYLDKPVFVELARHLSTKNILKNHVLDLNNDFYIVVSGSVLIHSIHNNTHQLLTTVKKGETISSFFNILSVLTEDIQDISDAQDSSKLVFNKHALDVIATAATVAVIPAEAFRTLTQTFPSSAVQMVQVILTRFQRVTFETVYKYLNLKSEICGIEKKIGSCMAGVPDLFFSAGITNLRKRHEEVRLYESSIQQDENGNESDSFTDLFKDGLRRRGPLQKLPRDISDDESGKDSDELVSYMGTRSKLSRKSLATPKLKKRAKIVGDILLDARGDDEMSLHDEIFDVVVSKLGVVNDPPYNYRKSSNRPSPLRRDSISSNQSSNIDSPRSSYADIPIRRGSQIEIKSLERGHILVHENERAKGIWLLIDGILEAYMDTKGTPTHFLVTPGSIVGYLSAVTGGLSYVSIRAKTDALVAYITKPIVERLVEKNPTILLTLAKRLVRNLTPLIHQIDFAVDWVYLSPGQVLYNSHSPSESIYIILNGRLRSIKKSGNKVECKGEYGRGTSLGELEVLSDSTRECTVHAIRESEVTCLPKTLFITLCSQYPSIMFGVSKIVAGHAKEYLNIGLKTVAILPTNSHVPVPEFADKLKSALETCGASVGILNNETVLDKLGRHAFSKIAGLKLSNWLSEQEEAHRLVLFVADGGVSSLWTQRCVLQADCILLVGLGSDDPEIGEYERLLQSLKTTARKELVLLHNDRFCEPGATAAWLSLRPWLSAHHHIQMQTSTPLFSKQHGKNNTFVNLSDKVKLYYTKAMGMNTTISPNAYTGIRSDFCRIARRLLNKSIGLVLGGGGARGLAHLGIIKALEEACIPIDMIGGTSIGSFIGGLYARENDHVSIYGRAKKYSSKMTSRWRMLIDLTYPVTSLFTGHELNRAVWKCFYETRIEDCWVPFYCCTVNITDSRMEVHRTGYMWRYGFLSLIIVRASMTLTGYFPPLCDEGKMLVDGGYLNTLPVDVMQELGSDIAIAVDVGSAFDTAPRKYGDSLSGWMVLLNRILPFWSRYSNVLPLEDIQTRLAFVGSVKQLEKVKQMENCLYLQPPVKDFGTVEFDRFQEIFDVGYKYGKEIVKKWENDGTLVNKFGVHPKKTGVKKGRRRASI